MTDQCKHCTLRGDIKKCRAAECFHHENWYAVQQQSEIDQLKQQRDELLAALKEAVDCGMVPTSSAKEGGANRHIKQLQVADMIRDAIKNAEGE